jgi:DNA-binding CsgD family transcriptional regulator
VPTAGDDACGDSVYARGAEGLAGRPPDVWCSFYNCLGLVADGWTRPRADDSLRKVEFMNERRPTKGLPSIDRCEITVAATAWQALLGGGPRRAAVAYLLTRGVVSDRELAEALQMSESRAHAHVQSLLDQARVDSRARLVVELFALEAGHRPA